MSTSNNTCHLANTYFLVFFSNCNPAARAGSDEQNKKAEVKHTRQTVHTYKSAGGGETLTFP